MSASTGWKELLVEEYKDKTQKEITIEMAGSVKLALKYIYQNRIRLDMSTFVIQYLSEVAQACIRALHHAANEKEAKILAMKETAKIRALVENL